jgi:hypothetical protein
MKELLLLCTVFSYIVVGAVTQAYYETHNCTMTRCNPVGVYWPAYIPYEVSRQHFKDKLDE